MKIRIRDTQLQNIACENLLYRAGFRNRDNEICSVNVPGWNIKNHPDNWTRKTHGENQHCRPRTTANSLC